MSWPHIILTLSVTRRPSMTLHWPQSHNTERTKSTKQRIRERDLHISAPRRPWHNWVLPGGPGFPDADIPKLLRTNQSPVTRSCDLTWPIRSQYSGKWPMRGQGVLSGSGTFHPFLVYCTISLHLIILIRSTMMWCCHDQEIWGQKRRLQLS